MKYLSIAEVVSRGIEFTGDVCYSGEYGQQVYTKEDIDISDAFRLGVRGDGCTSCWALPNRKEERREP